MSISGFRAGNHPQQVAKRGASGVVDDRGTDQAFFDQTALRFGGFDLDVAAAPHNAKCDAYYTQESNGLLLPWLGSVWCNPPYSDCGAWVRKAWASWVAGEATRIVMLLPANRTEQGFWQEDVEPYRDKIGSSLRVEFLRGRMRFDRPEVVIGPKGDRPPFGCCLLIWSKS